MKRILIANRGEIALRIVRACTELGLESVAVYSDVDRDLRHARLSTASLEIGSSHPKQSYLNRDKIIAAARATRCDAIHPGYGFLAEDPVFAEMCEANGIKFIGPSADSIRRMGDKIAAKTLAEKIGVPLVPGGTIGQGEDVRNIQQGLPYPVLLKASAGGGGRGMRLVHEPGAFAPSLLQAQIEAKEAFGDGTVYWEQYISNARHIEVQVISDRHGHHAHLGERDCTLQRRHQKLFEESPSPVLGAETRRQLCEASIKITCALGYEGAGTIEFLYDLDRGSFHFIEMNTRIQVEHPVTEMVTGLDLVREQLRIAADHPLGDAFLSGAGNGWSMECRVNAEDPANSFIPSPGRITRFVPPGGPGVRVDTHCETGTEISPFYDSMIAKLIVWDRDREAARNRMIRALKEFAIEGIKTTIPFHIDVLQTPEFAAAQYNTGWVESRRAREKAA
jgi:acetyl-CoA carboxylase biotin carboxylase subunit